MGDYRAQYEKYYNNARNGVSRARYTRIGSTDDVINESKRNINISFSQKIIKQFIYQLIGASMLLIVMLIAKNIQVKEVNDFYKLAKEQVNDNYEITDVLKTIEVPEGGNLKETVLDCIDDAKSYITGQPTLKSVIRSEYITPINGKITKYDDMANSIAFIVKENVDVVASFDGTIKKINEEGDKYIIIDHGNGVETYYGLVSEISVKEGDSVRRGDTIAKTGDIESLKSKGIIYKMMYMESEKNPEEMLDLSALEKV